MDEVLLNELLECSVCLERLDTSSRVLPCQHTFCLKCLKEIVQSHKELRCPECRVPVDCRLEELPPNVLLMRILEGMKTAVPRRQPPARDPRAAQAPQHAGAARHGGGAAELKQAPRAHALYDYISKEQGDLSFKRGDVIFLHKRVDACWYRGESAGRVGIFPVAYTHIAVPLPGPAALCKALYDFRMSAPDEEGCLAFDKGAIISVLRRVDENWAEGRLEERVGIFPIAFVELNHAARDLIHTHSPLVVGRVVPPVPDRQASPRATQLDHRSHTHQQPFRYQQMALSAPAPTSHTYQHVAAMSLSHPAHQQPPAAPLAARARQPGADLIQLHAGHTWSGHVKYDAYCAPVPNNTHQNVGSELLISAAFNANGTDSSSTVTTPSVSVSTSAPNTTSNSSSDSTEPSSPCSPDNRENANGPASHTNVGRESAEMTAEIDSSLNTSGVSRLNESACSTNTSLNVSLPPLLDSPKNVNVSGTSSSSGGSQKPTPGSMPGNPETPATKTENENHDAATSSKSYRPTTENPLSQPSSMSPSHGAESAGGFLVSRVHRDHHRDRDKRNSLTPGTHLQAHTQHANQNRHSAEIPATGPLERASHERDRARRRRSRSGDRPLPAPYVALYPYRPHKPDELELKKGVIYTVTERCQDGWYKGCSTRTQRCGVFPGNYVTPARNHDKVVVPAAAQQRPAPQVAPTTPATPLAPPRSASPTPTNGAAQPFAWPSGAPGQQKPTEKCKEKSTKQERSGVSLMRRLAAMKKCKSPPPAGFSCDNPVFEDCAGASREPPAPASASHPHRPVHVRSGSCPSQLLQPGAVMAAAVEALASGSVSSAVGQRLLGAARQRPSVLHARHARMSGEGVWAPQHQHRKTQSLDAGAGAGAARDHRKERHNEPPLNERFRCVVPYPPNSAYELELRLDDVVVVHRKRGDGWYRGTLERTGRTGLFPASFVQSCGAD